MNSQQEIQKAAVADALARMEHNPLVDGIPAQTLHNVTQVLAVLQAVDLDDSTDDDMQPGFYKILDICRAALDYEAGRMEQPA